MRTSLAALAFIFSATAALAQSPPSLTIDLVSTLAAMRSAHDRTSVEYLIDNSTLF